MSELLPVVVKAQPCGGITIREMMVPLLNVPSAKSIPNSEKLEIYRKGEVERERLGRDEREKVLTQLKEKAEKDKEKTLNELYSVKGREKVLKQKIKERDDLLKKIENEIELFDDKEESFEQYWKDKLTDKQRAQMESEGVNMELFGNLEAFKVFYKLQFEIKELLGLSK